MMDQVEYAYSCVERDYQLAQSSSNEYFMPEIICFIMYLKLL